MGTVQFGQRRYTLAEIEECGYRHGRDGIRYYPPHRWGRDDNDRGNETDAFDRLYRRGYDRGEKERTRKRSTASRFQPTSVVVHCVTRPGNAAATWRLWGRQRNTHHGVQA